MYALARCSERVKEEKLGKFNNLRACSLTSLHMCFHGIVPESSTSSTQVTHSSHGVSQHPHGVERSLSEALFITAKCSGITK